MAASTDIISCEPLRSPVGRMGGTSAALPATTLVAKVLHAPVTHAGLCIGGGQGLAAVLEAVS